MTAGVALAALTATVLLTGCATGARFAMPPVPSERAATMTLIRPSIMGFCCTLPMYVDDHRVATLAAREYATVTVPAGARVVAYRHSYGLASATVTVAPGDHVYVVADLSWWQLSLRAYPAALGREMIDGLRQVREVRDGEEIVKP